MSLEIKPIEINCENLKIERYVRMYYIIICFFTKKDTKNLILKEIKTIYKSRNQKETENELLDIEQKFYKNNKNNTRLLDEFMIITSKDDLTLRLIDRFIQYYAREYYKSKDGFPDDVNELPASNGACILLESINKAISEFDFDIELFFYPDNLKSLL